MVRVGLKHMILTWGILPSKLYYVETDDKKRRYNIGTKE